EGYEMYVYNRTIEKTKELAANGAVICDTPEEVGVNAEIVITMVSDTKDVLEVVFGETGIFNGLNEESIIINMRNISADETKKILERLEQRNIYMLDAPVSGGSQGAIDRKLSIMVGGDQEVFEQCLPISNVLGHKVTHVGDVGAGQIVKSCNQ